MAKRPVFISKSERGLSDELVIEFEWIPGLSLSQKRKNIASLHESIKKNTGIVRILEISSKSDNEIGNYLSAFNLMLKNKENMTSSVECFFQGSKKFSFGGPYLDIYKKSSSEAKKDERLKTSGSLVCFEFEGSTWPICPQTAFYNWLYIRALMQNKDLSKKILQFECFTDIEFNPEKSINCQAAAAALYVSLYRQGILESSMASESEFLNIFSSENYVKPIQNVLI